MGAELSRAIMYESAVIELCQTLFLHSFLGCQSLTVTFIPPKRKLGE